MMAAGGSGTGGNISADELRNLWAQAVVRIKQASHSPVLFRALESTVPIAFEDGQFVVGFGHIDGQMSGALKTGENLLVIERIVREIVANPNVRVRLIEGLVYQDWEEVKKRDVAAAAARTQVVQKRATESAAYGSWDQVYDQISRLWSSAEGRSLPTGRARFLDTCFELVLKAMASGMYPLPGTTAADEPTERGLSRVIERIASYSGSDGVIIGFLLMERWRARNTA